MISGKFHISQFEPQISDLVSLQGFATDLNECLISLGLRQDVARVLDAEFSINMGVLCTSLTLMATEKKVDSDWRFSQFGILYIVNDNEVFTVKGKDDQIFKFNHTELSLLIPILACRENILGALIQGFKNPFRMSLFYQNFLLHIMKSLEGNIVDQDKILFFLDYHKRDDYKKHEAFFNHYLDIDIK
ncbi:hypothetical protein [Comamonas sp.]|uniref:hypothetical protein n=1 Tax=Comamonas sp. TaxID=34028 RepID=UPI0012C53993|nr:hypothetical protein [Comamonas sp.]MPS92833.1 hypothetical protein [Comamonas sp.]